MNAVRMEAMQCQKAQELFSDYVDEKLDRAMHVSLENHIAGCGGCRETVSDLQRVWLMLDEMPSVEPSPFFHANLMDRIRMEEEKAQEAARKKQWDWRTLFQPRSLAWGGAALVLLLAGARLAHKSGAVSAGLDPIGMALELFAPEPSMPAPVFPTPRPVVPKTEAALPKAESAAPVAPKPGVSAIPMETLKAEWFPGEQGGEIVLSLKAAPGETVHFDASYANPVASGEPRLTVHDGIVNTDKVTEIRLPLPQEPTDGTLDVKLTADRPDGQPVVEERKLPILRASETK